MHLTFLKNDVSYGEKWFKDFQGTVGGSLLVIKTWWSKRQLNLTIVAS
jgi:hypothetical protein